MNRHARLAGRAYQEALRLRSRMNRRINAPLCPFDLADEMGLEARFTDIPSLEAMYVNDGAPKILIAADRPPGRQRFSCAHELGHHIFGHGTLLACFAPSEPDATLPDAEFIAHAFAGYLLLPKTAVSHAFAIRGWNPRDGVADQFYVVSALLGVSFDALVTHCEVSLRLLDHRHARALHAEGLPLLRARIAGQEIANSLTVVDQASLDVAVDLRVGDHLLAPPDSAPVNQALQIQSVKPTGTLFRACRPGLSGVQFQPEPTVGVVRIARAGYVGRAVFRHLEDPDYV